MPVGPFGYHPIFRFLDNTNEALSGILRPGRAGSNTAADHIEVLDQALTQIPDHMRHGTPILVRTDTAGATMAFLTHIRALRETGCDVRFSVGAPIDETVIVADGPRYSGARAFAAWAATGNRSAQVCGRVLRVSGIIHVAEAVDQPPRRGRGAGRSRRSRPVPLGTARTHRRRPSRLQRLPGLRRPHLRPL